MVSFSTLAGGASLVLVLGTPPSGIRWRKLSGPMPRASLGDVKDFQLVPVSAGAFTPDGNVLYVLSRRPSGPPR
jgi:hypothetical protein